MSEEYSSDEENRAFIRKYDMFNPQKVTEKVDSFKVLKLKNVPYCTYKLKRGLRKGHLCNDHSELADGLCRTHRRLSIIRIAKKVHFNRLKKTKIYHLVKCLDREEPIVILKDGDNFIRVRLPRSLKPIPRPKMNYLAFSRCLPEGRKFALWKRCQE